MVPIWKVAEIFSHPYLNIAKIFVFIKQQLREVNYSVPRFFIVLSFHMYFSMWIFFGHSTWTRYVHVITSFFFTRYKLWFDEKKFCSIPEQGPSRRTLFWSMTSTMAAILPSWGPSWSTVIRPISTNRLNGWKGKKNRQNKKGKLIHQNILRESKKD